MPAWTNPSFSLHGIVPVTKLTLAEPLRHHGRRLLNTFYSDEDAQPSSFDKGVKSHHMPGLSSTTAMQQGDGTTVEQLLDKNEHPADSAAVDSTPEAAAEDSIALSAGDSSSSPEPAQVLGFKDDVRKAAQSAADGAAHLKDSIANKIRGSESSHDDSDTAAVAKAHTTAVTSSDAVGGNLPSTLAVPPHGPYVSCYPASSTGPQPHFFLPMMSINWSNMPELLLSLFLQLFLHLSLRQSLQLPLQPPIEHSPTSCTTCRRPFVYKTCSGLSLVHRSMQAQLRCSMPTKAQTTMSKPTQLRQRLMATSIHPPRLLWTQPPARL